MLERKIAVVTTSRSEYGLLYWLLNEIDSDPSLALQLIVGGSHLSSEFGLMVNSIEDDFCVAERIEFLLSSSSAVGIGKSSGLAVLSFVESLSRLKPDILVLLGDRWEVLSAAMAATILRIPIAHIHGGELSYGSMDDNIRHAITKLSHLHFPCTDQYAQRIIQMGESPDRVCNYGAPGLDHIVRTHLMSRSDIEFDLSIKFSKLNILCTCHAETVHQSQYNTNLIDSILNVLDLFPDATIIFTKSNADLGSDQINRAIDRYVKLHPNNCYAFTALGVSKYLSLVNQIDLVLGNSSSGLIEVPMLGKPTVNVGCRQDGRQRSNTVIDCIANTESIHAAISHALSDDFSKNLMNVQCPYGSGNASLKIKDQLKRMNLDGVLFKKFVDHHVEIA